MRLAGIYARVSSDRQREELTIESQVAALIEGARDTGITVPDEWIFKDEGYSKKWGQTLISDLRS